MNIGLPILGNIILSIQKSTSFMRDLNHIKYYN